MKHLVSKVRAKKTKTREKQASKAASEKKPFAQSATMAVIIAVVLWISSILIIGMDMLLNLPADPLKLLPLAGKGVLLITALFGGTLFLQITRPTLLRQNSRILLMAIISLLSLTAARSLLYLAGEIEIVTPQVLSFAIPASMVPLMVTILIGSKAGIVTGLWNALTIALMLDDSFALFLAFIITTLIASKTARNVRTRVKVVKTGIAIGMCKVFFVLATTAMNYSSANLQQILHEAAACMISGFGAALIAVLILPMFESLFRITTNITLLELADLQHPLLQRLAIEAPGTYHHSLVVANLAQAAADEIGANSLLARICAYFHDVGKLTKPDFFSENIHLRDNPHDNLPPSMSTLVITSHVKEGLSLGVLYKLPPPIMNVIREHHGTSVLSYFHHKAKTQLEFELGQQDDVQPPAPQSKLDEIDFRYPGPRPSTRESGIICLADAVEAASRSIKKITQGTVEGLINDIVYTRLKDGQLDECDLTLRDLTTIKKSFAFTLTNMLHGRVPYPEPEDEDRDKQQSKPAQDQQDEDKAPDKPVNGEGKPSES